MIAAGRAPTDSLAGMTVTLRTARDEDRQALHDLGQQAFAAQPASYDEQHDRNASPLERRLVAEEAGLIIGKLAVWDFGQWFGGRRVPMGGVAGVAVAPDARGRGVATALLREAVQGMRERGEVISSLYPMNHKLYRRHGWEVAGAYPQQELDLRALTSLPRPRRPVALRPAVAADLPALRELHERACRDEPGNLAFGASFAARQFRAGDGQESYLAEVDGTPVGLLVTGRERPRDDRAQYALRVEQLFATGADAELALLRLVAAHHPVARHTTMITPPSSALAVLLGERDLHPSGSGWCWMTRLVDARGAVAARGFPDGLDAEVHLDIDDPLAGWNAGPHVLRVSGTAGVLEPGGRGTVRLGIGRLASLYSGWVAPHRLAHLGLIDGARDADLAALERIFLGRTPWARDFF